MADVSGSQDFPTVIGPDATFNGELSFEKGLRLQGKFQGKINSPGRLQVAKEARLQAEVQVGSITVEGEVKGNTVATDRIDLKQSARYEGDIQTTKLTVEEGATFSGHVSVGPEAIKNRPAGSGQGAGGSANRPAGNAPQPAAAPIK